MEDRKSDTEETFGEQDQPSPEKASGQNTDYPGASGSGGGSESPPATGTDEDASASASNREGGSGEREAGRVGGAGEHSQATGNPLNAG